ncbi:MAG: EAL domain-containing protein [Candidatus Scalindua sp.]|nr:EAL domain-containing protein [Candidatus Scalindua sp.]
MSIKSKMLISFGLMFTTLLIIVEFVSIYGIPFTDFDGRKKEQQSEVFRSLNLIADLKKERLLRWMEERRDDTKVICESNLLQSQVADLTHTISENSKTGMKGPELWSAVRGEKRYQDLFQHLNLVKTTYGVYENIKIADVQSGKIISSTRTEDLGSDIYRENFFTDSLCQRFREVMNIYKDPLSDKFNLIISSTMNRNDDDKVLAVLIMCINADDFIMPMLRTGGGLSDTDEVFLVDSDGKLLMPLKSPLGDGTIARPLEHRIKSRSAILAAGGSEGIIAADDYRGRPVLAAYRHIRITSEMGWGMVIKRDQAEVMAPLQTNLHYFFYIGLISIFVVLALTSVIAGRISAPIRHLSKTAKEVKDGNLNVQTKITTSDEAAILATTFNAMIRQIRNWNKVLRVQVTARTADLKRTNETLRAEISERRQAEEKIKHMAFHDCLTTLPNRVLFNDRLTLALAHAHRNNEMLAVLFLDLDRFKIINDTLGHAEGDRLLQNISGKLKNCIRVDDTIARFGGDEFNLLLPGINQVGDVKTVLNKILKIFNQPCIIGGQKFYITVSIGVAIFPNDGRDVDTLLKNADAAMYRVKEEGKNGYRFYNTAIHIKSNKKMIMENDLCRALECREFRVYYQPQVNIDTGRIVGVEALLRWQHPDQGLILPEEFLYLAEDTRLIVSIDKLVLHTVCLQNKIWHDTGFQDSRVAVNLSSHTFQEEDLVGIVTSILEKTGLDPHFLMLEITESVAMQNLETIIRKFEKLCSLGIQIAIDDFGTGYSSLYYLKKFPITKLKISQHFVRDIVRDQSDKAIVSLVIDLAQSLKFKVIAEGVEAIEQLSFLKQRKCDEMQGFLFSKPVPADEFAELLIQKKGLYN